MKTCWSARRTFTAYQDGELKPRRAQALESHLRGCPRCHAEFEELRRVTLLLRSLPHPARPEGYWPHALQRAGSKIRGFSPPGRDSPLDRFGELLEWPAQVLMPLALVCAALVNTLALLGLEGEAFAFLSFYLLPIVLD